jgi:hypothetical protein
VSSTQVFRLEISNHVPSGALCAHWTADAQTLWKQPVTDANLWAATGYYALLAKMPAVLARMFAGAGAALGTTLLWSLLDGRADNIMFDGGALVLFASAVFVYVRSALPGAPAPYPCISGS